jgi:hypothetical protein
VKTAQRVGAPDAEEYRAEFVEALGSPSSRPSSQVTIVLGYNKCERRLDVSICKYYSRKTQQIMSHTLTANRNPRRPIEHQVEKCSNPESSDKPGTITANVTCQGRVENCVIPENLR